MSPVKLSEYWREFEPSSDHPAHFVGALFVVVHPCTRQENQSLEGKDFGAMIGRKKGGDMSIGKGGDNLPGTSFPKG